MKILRTVFFAFVIFVFSTGKTPVVNLYSVALADGGQEKEFRGSKKKKKAKRSRTRKKLRKRSTVRKKTKKPRRLKPRKKKKIVVAKRETAAQLKKRWEYSVSCTSEDGFTIDERLRNAKDAQRALELSLDGVEELIEELTKLHAQQAGQLNAVLNWSANPYGEGRLKEKAKIKTGLLTGGVIITGKVNPYTAALGFIADGIEGIGRKFYKNVAFDAVLKDTKTIHKSLEKAHAAAKRLKVGIKEAKSEVKSLQFTSNWVFSDFWEYQKALMRENREKLKNRKKKFKATDGADLRRVLDLDAAEKEYLKSRIKPKRKPKGVTSCR